MQHDPRGAADGRDDARPRDHLAARGGELEDDELAAVLEHAGRIHHAVVGVAERTCAPPPDARDPFRFRHLTDVKCALQYGRQASFTSKRAMKNRLEELGLPVGEWLGELKRAVLRGDGDETEVRA